MVEVNQKVITKYGVGMVRMASKMKPQVYVSVPPASRDIFIFNLDEIQPLTSEWMSEENSVPGFRAPGFK